jgi:hydroxymethylbilane synthase
MKPIRIGSRGSTLALVQARSVKAAIENAQPEAQVEIVVIKTSGDRFVDVPMQSIGGKGLFTKEIEDALLNKKIDIAVHSMKDLPTELPDGLTIAAIPPREDPRDVLVSRNKDKLQRLSSGSKVGTGSLRRRAQILHYRADLSVVPIRGNVDTRLKKLDAGEVDALIMAAAGLKRIGQEDRIVEFIPLDICVSAVGQGALALETREGAWVRETLALLHDDKTDREVSAERAFLQRLGGGCQVPIGARAAVEGAKLQIVGVIANPDGTTLCRGEKSGQTSEAADLGRALAEQLLREGADKILGSLDRQQNYSYGES